MALAGQDAADLSDAELVAAVEDASLPEAAFRHGTHVRLGYIYLCRHGLPLAMLRMAEVLRGYLAAQGRPGFYHETITMAFLTLIHERLRSDGPADDWPAFAARHPELLDRRFLHHYYRPETLYSDRARQVFLLGEFSPEPYPMPR